jgi:hypothetical protein
MRGGIRKGIPFFIVIHLLPAGGSEMVDFVWHGLFNFFCDMLNKKTVIVRHGLFNFFDDYLNKIKYFIVY